MIAGAAVVRHSGSKGVVRSVEGPTAMLRLPRGSIAPDAVGRRGLGRGPRGCGAGRRPAPQRAAVGGAGGGGGGVRGARGGGGRGRGGGAAPRRRGGAGFCGSRAGAHLRWGGGRRG